jgi:hypothetical protein
MAVWLVVDEKKNKKLKPPPFLGRFLTFYDNPEDSDPK